MLREPGSGTREATDRWLRRAPRRRSTSRYELGSTEAIKRLVGVGAGIGCVSRHAVAQALREGWLVELKTRLPTAIRRLAIVVHRAAAARARGGVHRHCMQIAAAR